MQISQAGPIQSEAEYEQVIQELDGLLDRNPQAGTEEHDLLEFLSVLMEAYEAKHYPDEMFATTPQDAVDFMLGQKGCSVATLPTSSGERVASRSFLLESGISPEHRYVR